MGSPGKFGMFKCVFLITDIVQILTVVFVFQAILRSFVHTRPSNRTLKTLCTLIQLTKGRRAATLWSWKKSALSVPWMLSLQKSRRLQHCWVRATLYYYKSRLQRCICCVINSLLFIADPECSRYETNNIQRSLDIWHAAKSLSKRLWRVFFHSHSVIHSVYY